MNKDNVVISVIVTAHNRRKFLKEAITSALNQNFDKEKYEVIVVKNFEDQEIDSFMREKDVKSLYTEEEELGAKLKLGIEESKGRIICFLEDDDKFHEEKLRKVHQSFMRYKDLVLYRNNRFVIDEDGRVLLTPEVWDEEYISDYDEKVYVSLIKRKAWSINSSICVRKDDIELSQLEQFNIAVDQYLFFSVVMNRKPILLDHTPLTYYRVHNSNTSLGFKDLYTECKYRDGEIDNLSKIVRMMSKENKELAHAYYYLHFIDTKWNYDIICKDNRLEALVEGLKITRSPFLPIKSKLKYIGASFLNLFLHGFVKNYLIRLRSERVKKIPECLVDIKETKVS